MDVDDDVDDDDDDQTKSKDYAMSFFVYLPPTPAFDLAKNSQFGSVAKVTRRC